MRLFLPSFICVLILILHSYYFRGWRITLLFFGSCYAIKVLKCLGDSNPVTRDYYPTMDFLGLTYHGIPYGSYLFVIPVGWLFAHYVAWCIAEATLKNKPKKHDAFFPIIALSILGTGLVGVCMESVNEALHWWRWEPHVQTNAAQYFSVWTLWSVMFYYFFFIFYIKGPRQKTLNIAAFVYVILFFISIRVYVSFKAVMTLVYALMIFGQIPLYFLNVPKLRPMRWWYPEKPVKPRLNADYQI